MIEFVFSFLSLSFSFNHFCSMLFFRIISKSFFFMYKICYLFRKNISFSSIILFFQLLLPIKVGRKSFPGSCGSLLHRVFCFTFFYRSSVVKGFFPCDALVLAAPRRRPPELGIITISQPCVAECVLATSKKILLVPSKTKGKKCYYLLLT